MTGRRVLRPAKISDRFVPEFDEMGHCQFNSMIVIIDHCRDRMRINRSIHQHQRNIIGNTGIHDRIQSMSRRKNESVHIAKLHRLHNCHFLTLIIVRIRQYRDVSLFRQNVLDLSNNWRK